MTCIYKFGTGAVKVNDLMSWFSYDVMGEITFGEDFGMLANQKMSQELMRQRQATSMLAPINDATWIAHLGFALFSFLPVVKGFLAAIDLMCGRMESRIKVKTSCIPCVNSNQK